MSVTESESLYHDLERMSTRQILDNINAEDRKVPDAIAKAIPAIEKLVEAGVARLSAGGRLFYMGRGQAGASGWSMHRNARRHSACHMIW
jgi:N-acetylmuramic acid 6-phosphate etherase